MFYLGGCQTLLVIQSDFVIKSVRLCQLVSQTLLVVTYILKSINFQVAGFPSMQRKEYECEIYVIYW